MSDDLLEELRPFDSSEAPAGVCPRCRTAERMEPTPLEALQASGLRAGRRVLETVARLVCGACGWTTTPRRDGEATT